MSDLTPFDAESLGCDDFGEYDGQYWDWQEDRYCPICDGTGMEDDVSPCPACDGTGIDPVYW